MGELVVSGDFWPDSRFPATDYGAPMRRGPILPDGAHTAFYALLLLIAGLPDAMVVPVLRGLTVERYGMSDGAAHLFISASLVGATLIAGFATRLRKRFGLRRVICVSAAMNALLLMVMALPIGAIGTLLVRVLEGGADLMVYAVLFDRIAHGKDTAKRGARLGLGATVMMIGIALGMLLGGVIGRDDPAMVLVAGGVTCIILCLMAAVVPLGDGGSDRPAARPAHTRLLLAPMLQIFADRAAAGLLVTTVPLYLAVAHDLDGAAIGSRVGTIMLLMAIGIWPMGKVVDRLGAVRVRVGCTLCFSCSLLLFPMLMEASGLALAACVLMGLSAAGLFASALTLAAGARGEAGGMASFYAAGNAGFFVGPLLGGALVDAISGVSPVVYPMVFVIFGVSHAGLTALSLRFAAQSGGATAGETDETPSVTTPRGITE
ncbi:MAG: MFS transporter [Phycisphaerales bacterium]